ncbi:MAG TPA: hypothetical protein VFX27_06795 [Sphingobium sp.]|nr:hypothetical protein [Sphingobium sp.]
MAETQAERKQRLADALRANLRRRKAQVRETPVDQNRGDEPERR